jgi:hypothetical protein
MLHLYEGNVARPGCHDEMRISDVLQLRIYQHYVHLLSIHDDHSIFPLCLICFGV